MSLIKKCRPRITYDCCYVTRENIDEFLKIAEPEAIEIGYQIKKERNYCIVYHPFDNKYYTYGRYYIKDGYNNWQQCDCYDFDEDFEILK